MTPTPVIHRGEIWQVDLGPVVSATGQEIAKIRPCIVVSSDTVGKLELRVVVPLTKWKPEFFTCPWMAKITPQPLNGLTSESAADSFQVKSVSIKRFVQCLGVCTADEMDDVIAALMIVVEAP